MGGRSLDGRAHDCVEKQVVCKVKKSLIDDVPYLSFLAVKNFLTVKSYSEHR
jgi:hypothetical protein